MGTFINNFPNNYDERLAPVRLDGRRIDFYTASLQDIVIAKLYSGRATDVQDIIDPRVLKAINWERLEHLATAEGEAAPGRVRCDQLPHLYGPEAEPR